MCVCVCVCVWCVCATRTYPYFVFAFHTPHTVLGVASDSPSFCRCSLKVDKWPSHIDGMSTTVEEELYAPKNNYISVVACNKTADQLLLNVFRKDGPTLTFIASRLLNAAHFHVLVTSSKNVFARKTAYTFPRKPESLPSVAASSSWRPSNEQPSSSAAGSASWTTRAPHLNQAASLHAAGPTHPAPSRPQAPAPQSSPPLIDDKRKKRTLAREQRLCSTGGRDARGHPADA